MKKPACWWLVGSLLCVAPVAAQTERVYSPDEANAVLGAEPAPVSRGSADCVARLPNGQCVQTQDEERQVARAKTHAQKRHELPIRFLLGSSELTEQSKRNIGILAQAMLAPAHKDKRIRIEGHTDRSGSAALNKALSARRAEAVASYMANLGIDRSRLEPVGQGYERLLPGVAPTDPRHRRVEVARID